MSDDLEVTVTKYTVPMPLSVELLADSAGLAAAIHDLMMATPPTAEEAAARREQAARDRAEERAAAVEIRVTVESLVERMGWSSEYARHLVQPYCRCYEDGTYGWTVCEHAYDLGVTG